MELVQEKAPLRFAWGDVTFLVKPQTTSGDKFEIDMAGRPVGNTGQVEFSPAEFYRTLVRQFVVGWEGVTSEGKPVPYSYENLMRLPAQSGDDVVIRLGIFIVENTDVTGGKGEAALKNA